MTAILEVLLLNVPEAVETERLTLRATRAGMGPAIYDAVRESRRDLDRWMPWSKETKSATDTERHCREMQLKWHAREELDFCFHRRTDGLLVGKGGLHTIDWTVPRLMARSMLSFGMLWSVALSTASLRRGFMPGSPPPMRAATVISLISRVKILPRFASWRPLRCWMFAHLLWPAIWVSGVRSYADERENVMVTFASRPPPERKTGGAAP